MVTNGLPPASEDATVAPHIGTLVQTPKGWAVRDLYPPYRASGLRDAEALASVDAPAEGDVVTGVTPRRAYAPLSPSSSAARGLRRLARADSPRAAMYQIAAQHQLAPYYGPLVMAEVARHGDDPGLDDTTLEDLEAVPFVTIDGPGTRDLDQAVFIEPRTQGGFRLRYALADPAHAVAPGTALFEEALRRGATYYLPGLAIPMLPHALSEGVVSLSAGQRRRAVVFDLEVDRDGTCQRTTIRRARIRSRAQLTFRGVQRFLDGEAPLGCPEASSSVRHLRPLGERLIAAARDRDVIDYRRRETDVKIEGEEGLRFVVTLGGRTQVERYNEQLSLMCNVEGAKFLRRHHHGEHVQPIYRVHPEPEPGRYEAFQRFVAALVTRHGLDPSRWAWRPEQRDLGDYLQALPGGRLAAAIHRQAVLINVKSSFSPDAGEHFGVGAEVYARFSAPMREIVGVFLHKEIFEQLTGASRAKAAEDEALREAVVTRANEAKQLQKRITKAANAVVLDRVFQRDRGHDAPWRQGTVMGLTRSKVHVVLDDPAAVEVKVYVRGLGHRFGGNPPTRSDDGTALMTPDGRDEVCRVGDAVEVRVLERDRDRWRLDLRGAVGPDR